MKGVIPAHGQIDLKVWVVPTRAGDGEFPLRVFVHLLKTPLRVKVCAECFQVQPLLMYQDLNRVTHHMSCEKTNAIDIGVVESRIPLSLTFVLTNVGKPAFHYQWLWDSNALLSSKLSLSTANTTGLVGPQSKQTLVLQVTPLGKIVFSCVRLELVISKGPKFVMLLSGSAAQPLFKFSFSDYDFGACFVQSSDTEYYTTNLEFTNADEKPLLIEGEFVNQPYLKVNLPQTSVQPRSELSIPITFLPRACQAYSEILGFLVEGSYRHTVTIVGRGIDVNVSVVNPSDKLISLENVMAGKSKKKCLEVINRSEISICPTFSLEPQVPEVSLLPGGPIRILPHDIIGLTVKFSPVTVIKDIEQELYFNFHDTKSVLSIVKASSIGVKVCLDQDFLQFGTTVIGKSTTRTLALSNNGDLAVKFSWTVKNPVFTILPQEGFSAAGSTVIFTVSYTPEKLNANIRYQAVCSLSNNEELKVTFSGSCKDLPSPTMTIPMSCAVRQTTSTQIPIFNKYGKAVVISSSISGDYFSGDLVATVAPYGTHTFEVHYAPLMATPPAEVHKGSIVFNFVDGSCMVYALEGTAGSPLMTDRLLAKLFTHTSHTLLVPVHNWMQTPQKFHVSHSLESNSHPQSRYQLTYNDYFVVSGSQTRDLPLHMVCHFPGTLTLKVTLTNESNGDYVWFEVVFQVESCASLDDIFLKSTVRQPAHQDIKFYNPLDIPVTVEFSTNLSELKAVNTPLTVDPLYSSMVTLKYFPLWPCELTAEHLELTCAELGVFPYTVHVSALPPPPEAPLHLSCTLGLATHAHVELCNHASLQATFECLSSHEDVLVENRVTLAPEECKQMAVSYQPSSLANVSAEIVAKSTQAGQFVFPVIGTSKLPDPRGPFTVTPASSTKVTIKNIFREAKTFTCSVDNPVFVVGESTIDLQPNEVAEVTVGMLETIYPKFGKYPFAGKLTVSAKDLELSHIKWMFYIQGLFDPS